MAPGMSWIDTFADKAHGAIDWLADLGRRGNQRRVRVLQKDGGVFFETSLTLAVIIGLAAFLLFLPVALLLLGIAWLMGYRMEMDA